MWKCFGCGKGGDIFEFIKEIEGVEFGDALRLLANRAGVELKRENPQVASERKKLYEICDLACSLFEKQLGNSASGKEAKEYLLKRGISEDSLKKWRLGYSPDTWQGLSDFLVGRGYTRDEIVKAGLAVKSEKGDNPYDRFRGRIIFPIFDLNSQVIGFGARIFKDADGALLTRYPEGLASALEKISSDSTPMRVTNDATASLFIDSPYKGQQKTSWFTKLFSTHPPVEERIKALRGMEN
jgi:DNA primase catalytic core